MGRARVRRSWRGTAMAAVVAVVMCLSLTSCFESITDKIKSDLDTAIANIDQQSASWQAQLQTLEDELKQLPDEAVNVATEVQQLLIGTIQATTQETRCTIDFIGVRVTQALTNIKNKLLGKPPTPNDPHICTSNPPDAIQLKDVNSGVTHELSLSGYDLDLTKGFAIEYVDANNAATLVDSRYVSGPSPYSVDVNLSLGNGLHLPANTQKIVFLSNGTPIGDLNVEDVPPPPPPPPPVTVSNLHVTFQTHDDDKDDDSVLTVTIENKTGIQVASFAQRGNDTFDNNSTRTVTLSPFTVARTDLQAAKLSICIAPNGNDTWRFSYTLTGTVSTGGLLTVGQNSQQLTQDDRCIFQVFG